ncbi:hypothetical protein AYL99_11014 [Fonsecaea erecta]|uniref:DUF7924 domain-containing protein n=1 Tax=Fonsecaea erecta TaxID=1367422 RepID=A0A178Z523_9EURO|nr:hypothetical protein AYL99_11014 [Fonsecaea erecta]OAP54566.1 hypothetical protein AYL99_11014 [Fonsecaea erecta]
MAPRARLPRAKGKAQGHRTGSQSRTPIKKSTPKPQAGTRRSTRLANKTSVSSDLHLATPAPVSQRSRLKRKRPQDPEFDADGTESVRPLKQSPRLPPPTYQLTADNLRILNADMGSSTNDRLTLKRTLSRRSMTASETETDKSQPSAKTTTFYRYQRLAAVGLRIHTDIPDDIQAAVDKIVGTEVSEDRIAGLGNITKKFHQDCKEKIRGGRSEADFVGILRTALISMKPGNIELHEMADWREDLKPTIQRPNMNWSFVEKIVRQQDEVNNPSALPTPKSQQQSGQMGTVPQPSMLGASNSASGDRPAQFDMMPPPAPSLVKTPRPDISIGIQQFALIPALSAILTRDLTDTEFERFLQAFENITIPGERGESPEPLLIAVPTQTSSTLMFPFAVAEAKAYSTGRQVFEAQNQAAVSGACGLKMQLLLNELVKRSTSGQIDGPHPQSNGSPPLFFSICTEGPYHELWVHYTHMKNNIREFNMALLKICNGMLLESVGDFIAAVDDVMRWGNGKFFDSVVERLGIVARGAGL